MVRQDARVQHVGVGHDDRATFTRRAPRVARRVAVVDDARDAQLGLGDQLAQAGLLIARQRLGRIEVERARFRLTSERLEHRQVKTKALPAGGGRGDHEVPPGHRQVEGLGLMGVELGHSSRRERAPEPRVEGGRKGRRVARGRTEAPIGCQARLHVARRQPVLDGGVDARRRSPRGGRHGLLYKCSRIGPRRKSPYSMLSRRRPVQYALKDRDGSSCSA